MSNNVGGNEPPHVDGQPFCNCPSVVHDRGDHDLTEALRELEVLSHPKTYFLLKNLFSSLVYF